MKMFSTDEDIHNQDSQQIMLPIWVPILVSVLSGFAMGIGNCRNIFSVGTSTIFMCICPNNTIMVLDLCCVLEIET